MIDRETCGYRFVSDSRDIFQLWSTHVSVELVYSIPKYSIFNIHTFFLVGKERLKYLIGTNFRGHLISRKKGRHILWVFSFAIWVQNYFLPESIFAFFPILAHVSAE